MNTNLIPQAREDGLVVQDLDNETLVYDLDRNKAHCLDSTAGLIWRHCDGKTSVPEIAALLQGKFQLPVDDEVVWVALQRLGKANLLRERVTPPADSTVRSSRRELMRKLTVAGGVAVISIIAPTAAQAATCVLRVSCQNLCVDMSNPEDMTCPPSTGGPQGGLGYCTTKVGDPPAAGYCLTAADKYPPTAPAVIGDPCCSYQTAASFFGVGKM